LLRRYIALHQISCPVERDEAAPTTGAARSKPGSFALE
jgi:hypothetical protein